MMPAFIITGSTIIPAIRSGCSASGGFRLPVVERHDHDQIPERGGDPAVAGNTGRVIARTDLVGNRHVVAVVAGLEVADQIASGHRPGQVHGIHGGFGTGIGEPPQRQAEAAGKFAGVPHGLGLVDLPVLRRAAGRVFAGGRDQLGPAGLPAQEYLLLVGDQSVDRVAGPGRR